MMRCYKMIDCGYYDRNTFKKSAKPSTILFYQDSLNLFMDNIFCPLYHATNSGSYIVL